MAQTCTIPALDSMRPTHAKIVATLGPSTDSPEVICKLIDAGVSVFRLNFSHGTFDAHAGRVKLVRDAARELHVPVAIMGDLQGPKIRVGIVPDKGIELTAGDDLLIRTATDGVEPAPAGGGRPAVLPTNYEPLAREVDPGDRVLINDGAIRLLAVEREPTDPRDAMRCRVLLGGRVTSKKGINLPDSSISAPAVTARDIECVEWAVGQGLDLLALSFVRDADEINRLKRRLAGVCAANPDVDQTGEGALIPLIAKIERPQAVVNIEAITEAADGIMVARGDLGVEMDLAQVPAVQRRLIAAANDWGKPCIVATQMLESMIDSPAPTRAEASDVDGAIYDGADAVMLSGETAVGKHPVLVVETMRRIIQSAERDVLARQKAPSPPARLVESRYRTAALAHGAWYTASDLGAKLIACWSQHGGTARYLSQNGFTVPIIAWSSDKRQTRRMSLLRGVTPIFRAEPPATLGDWNRIVDETVQSRGWAREGQPILLLAGPPLGKSGTTTATAIHYVGNGSTGFMRVLG